MPRQTESVAEVLARLTVERYTSPWWTTPAPPEDDTDENTATRRRRLAADYAELNRKAGR
jgi:hypothetical protein